MPDPSAKDRLQRALCLIVGQLMRGAFGLRAIDVPRLDGPYILAPNHASFLDPMVVQLPHARPITFLMDGPIFRNPAMSWFFRFWGAIPVPDARVVKQAFEGALQALRAGRVVGIFPEGRISRDGRLQPGKPGVASLALRARVPVVPVAILGSHGILPRRADFPRPGRLLVAFGEAIVPPADVPEDDRAAGRELTVRIMAAIDALARRHASRL